MTETTGNTQRLPIIAWENALAFSGPLGPKPIVRAVLFTMARRADNTTLTFFMGVDEISHIMGTGYSTAENHLKRALESGWVEQTSRGGSFGKVSSFRLTFGATENPEGIIPPPPKRMPLPAKSEGNPREVDGSDSVSDTGEDGNPSEVRDGTPQNRGMEPLKSEGPTTPELLQTTTLTLDRTLTRGDTEREETDEPKPLHETWVPNNTNRLRADRMGYDPAKLVGNFHRRVSARESRNWNRTFGYFLSCVEKGWHEVEDQFPVDPVLGHTGIVEKVTTLGDTISVPAPVPESPEPSPVEDELPVTFQRPEWLSEREERSARFLAGHPCDDDLADALAEYISLCESLGRAPIGSEFPTFAKTHLHR